MKRSAPPSIRKRIRTFGLLLVLSTALLGMAAALLFSLQMERQHLDRNLTNSALVLAQSPGVADVLAGRRGVGTLAHYLDGAISRVQDIDAIVVASLDGQVIYAPDPSKIGGRYPGYEGLAVLSGQDFSVDTGAGISEVEHRAMASVHDTDGTLLGFVSVGIGVRHVNRIILQTAACFAVLTFFAVGAGLVLSRQLSGSIKKDLMGYEPDAFRRLFHQREDILEALDEGILAIDRDARVIYANPAGLRMLGAAQLSDVAGRPLSQVYPESLLPRLLTTGRPEYNVPVRRMPGIQEALSDRMPLWEDGQIAGAVAIFRDRTEATALAEELTGSRHLVEAMRAYTHEFLNKLHTILGLIQLGKTEQAEQYILDISQTHHQSVSRVADQIQDTAVAALLVGKTSRAAELGIRLQLDPKSALSADGQLLPSGVLVTILGNLIENATQALERSRQKQREITVSIREKERRLFLCVEDTGPGILPELLPHIFDPGFSTRGSGHGTGLSRVKELVELYHGSIRVESDPKSGTSFFLLFPAGPAPQPGERRPRP